MPLAGIAQLRPESPCGNVDMMTLIHHAGLMGAAAGSLVGFSLGLGGGGGSILALPLMVYLVGVEDPHVAIGQAFLVITHRLSTNLSATP